MPYFLSVTHVAVNFWYMSRFLQALIELSERCFSTVYVTVGWFYKKNCTYHPSQQTQRCVALSQQWCTCRLNLACCLFLKKIYFFPSVSLRVDKIWTLLDWSHKTCVIDIRYILGKVHKNMWCDEFDVEELQWPLQSLDVNTMKQLGEELEHWLQDEASRLFFIVVWFYIVIFQNSRFCVNVPRIINVSLEAIRDFIYFFSL